MKTFQTFQEDVSAATQFRKGQKAIERIEAPFTQRKRREEEWRKRVRRMRKSQQRESYEIQMEQVPSMTYGLTPSQELRHKEKIQNTIASAGSRDRARKSRVLFSKSKMGIHTHGDRMATILRRP